MSSRCVKGSICILPVVHIYDDIGVKTSMYLGAATQRVLFPCRSGHKLRRRYDLVVVYRVL